MHERHTAVKNVHRFSERVINYYYYYLFITPLRQHSKYKHTEHINIMHDKDLQNKTNYALNDAINACVTLSLHLLCCLWLT